MDMGLSTTLLAGDPRLVEHIVGQVKSQGIFDQFRKECTGDVDTKPAYQNLRTRVESSVNTFLKTQNWKPDMNKNQLRETLRKSIHDASFLDVGVERIVDQVVNPKIYPVFMPQIEDVVYKFLGMERPKPREKNGSCVLKDLLPKDLDPVSPESDRNSLKEESLESMDISFEDKVNGQKELIITEENKPIRSENEIPKEEELKKIDDLKNVDDCKKEEDAKKVEDFKKIEDVHNSEELNDARKIEEIKKIEECKKLDDTKKEEEEIKSSEEIKNGQFDIDENSMDGFEKPLNASVTNLNASFRSDDKTEEEEESPQFEPIDIMNFNESNISNDSHLSGISELTSHRSRSPDYSNDFSRDNFEFSNQDQDSQLSKVSSNSRLSIVTDFGSSNQASNTFFNSNEDSKDNFKIINEIEEAKFDFDGINKTKENLPEKEKDSKSIKSLSSRENSRDETDSVSKEKNDNRDVKEKSESRDGKERSGSKDSKDRSESKDRKERSESKDRKVKSESKEKSESSKSKKEKSDSRDSRDSRRHKDRKKSSSSSSRHSKSRKENDHSREKRKDTPEKTKDKNKEERDKDKEEKKEKDERKEKEKEEKQEKEKEERKEKEEKKDGKKDQEKQEKDIYKEKIRELREKKELTEKEKLNKDAKEKKDSSRDKKDYKKDHKTSRSSERHDKSSKSKSNDSNDKKRDDRRHSKDNKSRSSRSEKDSRTKKDEKDSKKESSSSSSSKSDSQSSKEKKQRDEKKSKSKDDHSSLKKNSNDRRSTDRDGSNGSNGKSSQKSSSSSTKSLSTTTLTKEVNNTNTSSGEASEGIEDSQENDTLIPCDLETEVNVKSDENSLPLKKRPLYDDSFTNEPKRSKMQNQTNKEKEKIVLKISKGKIIENSPIVEDITKVPDEERVQIIEVPAEDCEEAEEMSNMTLAETAMIILQGELVDQANLIHNDYKKESKLSLMEESIRKSLDEMMSDQKLLESGNSVTNVEQAIETEDEKNIETEINQKKNENDSHLSEIEKSLKESSHLNSEQNSKIEELKNLELEKQAKCAELEKHLQEFDENDSLEKNINRKNEESKEEFKNMENNSQFEKDNVEENLEKLERGDFNWEEDEINEPNISISDQSKLNKSENEKNLEKMRSTNLELRVSMGIKRTTEDLIRNVKVEHSIGEYSHSKKDSENTFNMKNDIEDACLYFVPDNERYLKFTNFLNAYEKELDTKKDDNINQVDISKIVDKDKNMDNKDVEKKEIVDINKDVVNVNKEVANIEENSSNEKKKRMAPPKRKLSSSPLSDILLHNANNNNDGNKEAETEVHDEGEPVAKRKKLGRPKKQRPSLSSYNPPGLLNGENFVFPLSPESDVSATSEKIIAPQVKEEKSRQRNNQRYSSDDLYKPRPLFASSSRRNRRSNQA